MKKLPSKAAHNWPLIFFMYWPGCPNSPKTEIQYHQKNLNAGLDIQTGGLTRTNLKKKNNICGTTTTTALTLYVNESTTHTTLWQRSLIFSTMSRFAKISLFTWNLAFFVLTLFHLGGREVVRTDPPWQYQPPICVGCTNQLQMS